MRCRLLSGGDAYIVVLWLTELLAASYDWPFPSQRPVLALFIIGGRTCSPALTAAAYPRGELMQFIQMASKSGSYEIPTYDSDDELRDEYLGRLQRSGIVLEASDASCQSVIIIYN